MTNITGRCNLQFTISGRFDRQTGIGLGLAGWDACEKWFSGKTEHDMSSAISSPQNKVGLVVLQEPAKSFINRHRFAKGGVAESR